MELDLTDKIIMRLPLPSVAAGARDYPDQAVKQLTLTVRPTGSRSWTLRYRAGEGAQRKQRRLTVGTWPEMKIDEARELAIRARKLLAQGIDPIEWEAEQRRQRALERQEIAERSFARMAESFVRSQRKSDVRSWVSQARILGLRVRPGSDGAKPKFALIEGGLAERWKDKPIATFERLDLALAINEFIDRDLPEAARARLAIVRSFFNWAVNQGYLNQSPIEKFKLKLEKVTRSRVLSDDELRLLWQATEAEHYPFQQFIRFLVLTGQRRCEASGLRFSEIGGGNWELPAARSKNKRAHLVPLSSQAADLIKSCPRHLSGYVFTSRARARFADFQTSKDASARGWRSSRVSRSRTGRCTICAEPSRPA